MFDSCPSLLLHGDVVPAKKAIPGADENTVESEVKAGSSTYSKPSSTDLLGDVDDLLDGLPEVAPVASVAESLEEGAPSVLIHFTRDGFSAMEQMWYRGQELEVETDSSLWTATKDRNGDSWMLMTEKEQETRLNHVFFRPGPWPHDEAEDERARELEQKRARRPAHPSPGFY